MHAEREVNADALDKPGKQIANLPRNGHSDRIGQANFLCACIDKVLRKINYALGIDGAFERAAKACCNCHLRTQSVRLGELDHGGIGSKPFGNGLTLVSNSKAVRRDENTAHFIDTRRTVRTAGDGAFDPAQIEAKPGCAIGTLPARGKAGNDGFGIRHLRHAVGIDEASDFNPVSTAASQTLDQGQFIGDRYKFRLVLQAIAWRRSCHSVYKSTCPMYSPEMTSERERDLQADYAAAGFGNAVPPGQNPVLILIDFARAYFDPAASLYAGVENERLIAGKLRAAAQAAHVPVIFTRVDYDSSDPALKTNQFYRKVAALKNFDRGNPMSEFTPELCPGAGDEVLVKQYPSAFFGTNLASDLHARGIDTCIIAGLSTSGCVRATALDALCHGFVPIVVRDACGDRDAAVHAANLFDLAAKYATVVESSFVIDYLNQLPR
jgi:maleamate amidohydrolase